MGLACGGCAMPQLGRQESFPRPPCPGCARRKFAFAHAFSGFEYGAALATAIVRMKHGGRPDLARRLGRIMQDVVSRALTAKGGPFIDAVLPVPLHPRRLRKRGFNQALELARAALGHLGDRRGAVTHPPALERRLLLRVKETRELGRSGPDARRAELDGAFAVADPARVIGRRFLIVDDVMTTGATLNACAAALLREGAKEVRVVALARAV
ncbi:MAG: ComF family protein [Deltaproteobacteria bacterium]|nr:ComF family protein [Deltaproteobacteria bacterium]